MRDLAIAAAAPMRAPSLQRWARNVRYWSRRVARSLFTGHVETEIGETKGGRIWKCSRCGDVYDCEPTEHRCLAPVYALLAFCVNCEGKRFLKTNGHCEECDGHVIAGKPAPVIVDWKNRK